MAFKLKSGNTSPFKMMGSSPAKNVSDPRHAHYEDGKHKMTETRTDTSFTRTKGDKSSTYDMDNSKTVNNKDGSRIYTFTNELGNSVKEIHSSQPSKKKSPAKQKLNKEGEGQDQNKIFDAKGNHIGNYVNGKKVMKSTTSAHGQLSDAERDFKTDTKNQKRKPTKPSYKTTMGLKKPKSPAKQKVDPDAPGTPGKPGYEPPVKRSDLDAKGKAIWDAHRAKKKGTGVIMGAKEEEGKMKNVMKMPGKSGASFLKKGVKGAESSKKGSPAKQKDPFEKLYKKVNPKDPKAIEGKHYPSKETVKKLKKGPYTKGGQNAGNFNMKGGKTTTPGHSTTKIAKTQNFRDAANKIKTVSSKTNVGSKVVKASKFLRGKSLGVLGMLTATSSKADQPTDKQKGVNKKQNVDFKGINASLKKASYKPLKK